MATHRDVAQITSYSCPHCDFEQIKVGGGVKWVKLIDRLHKKKCKKTGRTEDRTSNDKLILMTTCSGKLGTKRQTIKHKSGCGQEIKQNHEIPALYPQKLGIFKQQMTEKVQEQIKKGEFDYILPKDAKLGKPRMINIDSTDGVAMLVGQQKIIANHDPDKKLNTYVTKGTPLPDGGYRESVFFHPEGRDTISDDISRKIMSHLK